MVAVITLSGLGILLSGYAIYVKLQSGKKGYKPFCDLSQNVSCTKAFTSEYGKLLLIDNALLGLLYYILLLLLSFTSTPLYPITIAGAIGSLILAYLSYVQMKNFCLICTATYLINFLLLIVTI
jgi:vitamin-K-epoxide reductase (warfarin-sensitive)